MADENYEIREDYEYNSEIRALKNTDKASATDTFNPLNEKLINNTHAVKISVDTHKIGGDHDNRYYKQDEIDNKLSTLETNIDWKESVATYADIFMKYPNPEDGWTVNVKDTDYTYRWTGTEWVAISANAIPIASKAVDGKMSKEQVSKLESIENNANDYIHPSTSGNKHIPSGGAAGAILKWTSDGTAVWQQENQSAEPTATTPKAAGTAVVGSESKYARGDHVHPVQTTVSGNAGTATKLQITRTIGLSGAVTGTATNFDGSGNITIPTTALNIGNATAGTLPIARGGTGSTSANEALTTLGAAATNHTHSSYAPTSHASTATTYGIGTSGNYGHVKLTDSVSSTSGQDTGVAASAKAIKAVADRVSTLENNSGNSSSEKFMVTGISRTIYYATTGITTLGQSEYINNAGTDFAVVNDGLSTYVLFNKNGIVSLSGFYRFKSSTNNSLYVLLNTTAVFGAEGIQGCSDSKYCTLTVPQTPFHVSSGQTLTLQCSGGDTEIAGLFGRFTYRYLK